METSKEVFNDHEYQQAVETIERVVKKVTGVKFVEGTDFNSAIILIADTMNRLDKALVNGGKEN